MGDSCYLWNSQPNIWFLDSAYNMRNCFYFVFDYEIPTPILEVMTEKEKLYDDYSERFTCYDNGKGV